MVLSERGTSWKCPTPLATKSLSFFSKSLFQKPGFLEKPGFFPLPGARRSPASPRSRASSLFRGPGEARLLQEAGLLEQTQSPILQVASQCPRPVSAAMGPGLETF